MGRYQRALIYGSAQEYQNAVKLLNAIPTFDGTNFEYAHVDSHDDFQIQLVEWDPTLAIVLADGAAGMEGVYLVRKSRPATPVFWFSDDRNFGMQSHRLECACFSTKPLTAEKLHKAFRASGDPTGESVELMLPIYLEETNDRKRIEETEPVGAAGAAGDPDEGSGAAA